MAHKWEFIVMQAEEQVRTPPPPNAQSFPRSIEIRIIHDGTRQINQSIQALPVLYRSKTTTGTRNADETLMRV